MESLHAILILAIAATTTAQAVFNATCTSQFAVTRHPTDCRIFYTCIWGNPVEKQCAPSTVFSLKENVCVWPGSDLDDCTVTATANVTDRSLTVEEQCAADPTAVFPNPEECHQFFNCSRGWTGNRYFLYPYKDECIYPNLFNAEKLKCEDYDLVKCGQRTERKNGCDYDRNKCGSAHCIPCSLRFPDCQGKADGVHPDEARLWSPYYAVCKDERSGPSGTCARDSTFGMPQLFSPDLGRCANLYEIPREKGGYLLDCAGRADGAHPDDATGRTNVYYVCRSGQRTDIAQCPGGQVYGGLETPCVGFEAIPPS